MLMALLIVLHVPQGFTEALFVFLFICCTHALFAVPTGYLYVKLAKQEYLTQEKTSLHM